MTQPNQTKTRFGQGRLDWLETIDESIGPVMARHVDRMSTNQVLLECTRALVEEIRLAALGSFAIPVDEK